MPSNTLVAEKCVACRADARRVSGQEARDLLTQLPNWVLVEDVVPKLFRRFSFNDFVSAMAFAQKVSELAESLDHHPKLVVEWGSVEVFWWTHKISGLHRNDFVSAAKTDALL